jgi:hypothetical protein
LLIVFYIEIQQSNKQRILPINVRSRSIIILVCLAALALRLVTLAQTPTLAPEAYDTIRQVEHIRDTGVPFLTDPIAPELTARPLPLFPYLLAFGTLLAPSELVYALLPNLFAILLHAALFLLTLELTNNRLFAALAAIASIFIPGYLQATTITVSALSLAVPLLFFTLTLFIKLRKSKERRWLLLALTVALLLTHPLALLLIPTLLVALGLATLRRAHGLAIQYEYALFATALITWAHLLYYRDNILAHGLDAIHGNLPESVRVAAYGSPSILALGLAVGVVPFGLALYAAYKEGVARHPGIQTTIALAASAALGVAFALVPIETGTILFACACIPLAAVGLQHLRTYGRTLHHQWIAVAATTMLLALFIFTSGLASIIVVGTDPMRGTPSDAIAAAQWIRENSLPNAVVLSSPELSDLVLYEAQRAPFLSNHYLAEDNVEERYVRSQVILSGEASQEEIRNAHIDYILTTTMIRNSCTNTVRRGEYNVDKVLCN